MIAWSIACSAALLCAVFYALWRRERALRLDAEEREQWWMDIMDRAMDEDAEPAQEEPSAAEVWQHFADRYDKKNVVN